MRKSILWLSTALACGLGPAACTNQDAQTQSDKMILAAGADRNWTV
jgi:hypothetical protein